MALAFALHEPNFEEKLVDKKAEEARATEHRAAVQIQRCWKGKRGRKWLASLKWATTLLQVSYRGHFGRMRALLRATEKMRNERYIYFSTAAIKIQKVWRGYRSRKHVFSFARRQKYIEVVKQKAAEMREYLAKAQVEWDSLVEKSKEEEIQKKITKFASSHHHLVGTKAVPGVAKDSALGISEDVLKKNELLESWIRQNIEKNTALMLKRPQTPSHDILPKLAQGPFLPRSKLEKIKLKPLRPTLRVQTDYYDTKNTLQNQKRQELSLRVVHAPFIVRHRPERLTQLFLADSQKVIKSQQSMFSDTESNDKMGKKRFKNIIMPKPFFEEWP